eukprot:7644743-Pyramimonas_sp.AAC.1
MANSLTSRVWRPGQTLVSQGQGGNAHLCLPCSCNPSPYRRPGLVGRPCQIKGTFASCVLRPMTPAFLWQRGPRKGLVASRVSSPIEPGCTGTAAR